VKSSAVVCRVKVSAEGQGEVSHAGVCMLREMADLTGLSAQGTAAWPARVRGRGSMRLAMGSPIWPLGWPTARTA
jgi:hypothetical protein